MWKLLNVSIKCTKLWWNMHKGQKYWMTIEFVRKFENEICVGDTIDGLSNPILSFSLASFQLWEAHGTPEADAQSAAGSSQPWSSKNEEKPMSGMCWWWWTRVMDDGPELGPWWQVHFQVVRCVRKITSACLCLSNWCSLTCSWILF